MINVTQPFVPPIAEYFVQVQGAYDNNWLTNGGELVLEDKIQIFFGSEGKPLVLNNGTIPLQIASKLNCYCR